VNPFRTRTGWPIPALFLAGLAALYSGALGLGFINDDYLFLEQVRRHGFLDAVLHPGGLGNYFRPLSREAWFGLVGLLTGGDPIAFHLVQFVVFAAALVLLADLLAVFAPRRESVIAPAALVGLLFFATLPLQRVNLGWVSCSQDLLALTGSLAALALFRRGRTPWAMLAYAAAVLSKQSALPLPAALFLWAWCIEGETPRRAFARVLPFGFAALPWAVGELWLRQHSTSAARLVFDANHLAAALVHLGQSLAGVEHASGWLRTWSDARPSVIAFALLALVGVFLPDRALNVSADEATPAPTPKHRVVLFALGWLLVFTLPVWPVAYYWSSYYYTLAAVAGAVLVTLVAGRVARWSWILLSGALLWWHAAGVSSPAFAVVEDPWVGTSHLTPFYLERAAELSNRMRTSLRETLPIVGRDDRLFFIQLAPWAGFQMGNGPSVRHLYKDDTLESHFYSAFGESTAAQHTCRFLFWDGRAFQQPYANVRDPFFQVGSDLLLLERHAGARWAFRRGLEAGGERLDHAYWLGWAALWEGDRALAERAWRDWGAHDDSTARITWLRKARGSLIDGDTLKARRELLEAVRAGIGQPEAHAMLGLLLQSVNAKYALLETLVAARLKPEDWLARRDLAAGLAEVRLDEPAARELAVLKTLRPQWREDSVAVRVDSLLGARRPTIGGVVVFGPGGTR